jgi:hypothetical protein
MSADEVFEAYRLPEEAWHPAVIADRVLRMPEHAHLREGEATIDWLMRRTEKRRGGRWVLGTAYQPQVKGDLSEVFDWLVARLFGRTPDFLIVLDEGYWLQAGPREREILVFHELSHCVQKEDQYGSPKFDKEGRPVWGLRGHDVEEFISVAARYGAWTDEIRQFVDAVNHHG